MASRLRRVLPGEPITAAAFNALVDAVNRLSGITGAFPIEIHDHPGGVHVSLATAEREAVARLTSQLPVGGETPAQLLEHDGSAWQDSDSAAITVHDPLGSISGCRNDRVLVRFNRHSGQWLIWQPHGPMRRGRLEAALAPGGSAPCSLFSGGPGNTVDSGDDLTVHDWLLSPGDPPIASGSKVLIALINGYWWVFAASC